MTHKECDAGQPRDLKVKGTSKLTFSDACYVVPRQNNSILPMLNVTQHKLRPSFAKSVAKEQYQYVQTFVRILWGRLAEELALQEKFLLVGTFPGNCIFSYLIKYLYHCCQFVNQVIGDDVVGSSEEHEMGNQQGSKCNLNNFVQEMDQPSL